MSHKPSVIDKLLNDRCCRERSAQALGPSDRNQSERYVAPGSLRSDCHLLLPSLLLTVYRRLRSFTWLKNCQRQWGANGSDAQQPLNRVVDVIHCREVSRTHWVCSGRIACNSERCETTGLLLGRSAALEAVQRLHQHLTDARADARGQEQA